MIFLWSYHKRCNIMKFFHQGLWCNIKRTECVKAVGENYCQSLVLELWRSDLLHRESPQAHQLSALPCRWPACVTLKTLVTFQFWPEFHAKAGRLAWLGNCEPADANQLAHLPVSSITSDLSMGLQIIWFQRFNICIASFLPQWLWCT